MLCSINVEEPPYIRVLFSVCLECVRHRSRSDHDVPTGLCNTILLDCAIVYINAFKKMHLYISTYTAAHRCNEFSGGEQTGGTTILSHDVACVGHDSPAEFEHEQLYMS